METHNIFGYTRRVRAVPRSYSLQHPDSSCCLTLEALPDVVSVSPGPILKQHLSGLAGPGQRLQQVLHLVGGAFPFKRRLWYISYRYHLLSWSDPHYRPVIALCGTHLPQTGEGSPRKSPLQKRRLLQHAEEFWEIIPHLLIHCSHQADLSHCPGSVCAVTVCSLHLRVEVSHSCCFNIFLSQYFHFDWS